MSRPSARDCLRVCLTRVREVSPARVLFGDEPWVVLMAVVVGGFAFYPLVRDEWPWLLVVVMVAVIVHAWYWCCQEARAHGANLHDQEAP